MNRPSTCQLGMIQDMLERTSIFLMRFSIRRLVWFGVAVPLIFLLLTVWFWEIPATEEVTRWGMLSGMLFAKAGLMRVILHYAEKKPSLFVA